MILTRKGRAITRRTTFNSPHHASTKLQCNRACLVVGTGAKLPELAALDAIAATIQASQPRTILIKGGRK